MTVQRLLAELGKGIRGKLRLAADAEGNRYHPFEGFAEARFVPTYPGASLGDLAPEGATEGVPCVALMAGYGRPKYYAFDLARALVDVPTGTLVVSASDPEGNSFRVVHEVNVDGTIWPK